MPPSKQPKLINNSYLTHRCFETIYTWAKECARHKTWTKWDINMIKRLEAEQKRLSKLQYAKSKRTTN